MSNFPLLEIANRRRGSEIDADKAYMKHWNTCHRTFDFASGGEPCSVFGLCTEGQRLNVLCPDYQLIPVTELGIFCLIAEIMELRTRKVKKPMKVRND